MICIKANWWPHVTNLRPFFQENHFEVKIIFVLWNEPETTKFYHSNNTDAKNTRKRWKTAQSLSYNSSEKGLIQVDFDVDIPILCTCVLGTKIKKKRESQTRFKFYHFKPILPLTVLLPWPLVWGEESTKPLKPPFHRREK